MVEKMISYDEIDYNIEGPSYDEMNYYIGSPYESDIKYQEFVVNGINMANKIINEQ